MPRRQSFDRQQFIHKNLSRTWSKSTHSRAIHLEAGGFHMLVMTDHSDRSVWTWCVSIDGRGTDEKWSPGKCRTEGDAKLGALEEVANRIEEGNRKVLKGRVVQEDANRYCDRCSREISPDDLDAAKGLCGECNDGWEKVKAPD